MELSNQALIVGYAIVFALAGALLWYIVNGTKRAKEAEKQKQYNWSPETDYDVVQTGEGPMTPAWPQLRRKRNKLSNETDDGHHDKRTSA